MGTVWVSSHITPALRTTQVSGLENFCSAPCLQNRTWTPQQGTRLLPVPPRTLLEDTPNVLADHPSGPPCSLDRQKLPSHTSVSAVTASIWSGCAASLVELQGPTVPLLCGLPGALTSGKVNCAHLLHSVTIQLIHNCVCSLFSCSSDCDLPSSTTDVAGEPRITQNHLLQP